MLFERITSSKFLQPSKIPSGIAVIAVENVNFVYIENGKQKEAKQIEKIEE